MKNIIPDARSAKGNDAAFLVDRRVSLPAKFAAVGFATLASRIGGFLRDALIAALLGAGGIADAVFAAFLLPNLFRRMLTEGAFNAAFIPIFTRREAACGYESAAAFAGNVLKALLLLLVVIFALAILFMPWIVKLLVGGYREDPQKFADTVLFSRIAFAYVVAITLTAFFAAVLNAIRRYRFAALVPVIFNLVLVTVLAVMLATSQSDLRKTGFVIVSLIAFAGLVQLIFIIAATVKHRRAIAISSKTRLSDPDVRRFAALLLPGVIVAGAGHVNMLVAVHLASAMPASVSWLYYADRLFQLPLGLVATSIGVVMLPDIARHLHDGDKPAQRAAFSRSLEFALALTLPAAVALVLMAAPIVEVLYRHGSFNAEDGAATATVLQALAIGLPAFVLVKVFLPSFLAREKFGWPIVAAVAAIAANILATALLWQAAGFAAPAWGVTVSAWLNSMLLGLALVARGELALDGEARRRLPRIVAAAAISGVVIYGSKLLLASSFAASPGFAAKAILLGFTCFAGVFVHACALLALRAVDSGALSARWRSERSASAS